MQALTQVPNEAALKDTTALCNALAKSELIPPDFRNKPTNCLLAVQYAGQMALPILTVMQAMYVPKRGAKVGFSAEFYLGRLLASGAIYGTVRYDVHEIGEQLIDGRLPDIVVTARATDAKSGEDVEETITMRQAHAEGWAKRVRLRDGSGELPSKYETMGVQMLKKRAVTWLVRNHYPDVMQGCMERDEIDDVLRAERAREAEVVDKARERAKIPPGQEVPIELKEEPDPAQRDIAPEDRVTQEQEHAIFEWMHSGVMDGRAIQEYLEGLGCKSPEHLTRDEARELLEGIDRGDFELDQGDAR